MAKETVKKPARKVAVKENKIEDCCSECCGCEEE